MCNACGRHRAFVGDAVCGGHRMHVGDTECLFISEQTHFSICFSKTRFQKTKTRFARRTCSPNQSTFSARIQLSLCFRKTLFDILTCLNVKYEMHVGLIRLGRIALPPSTARSTHDSAAASRKYPRHTRPILTFRD